MTTTDTRLNNFGFLRLSAAILVLFSHCYPLAGRLAEEPILNFLGTLTAHTELGPTPDAKGGATMTHARGRSASRAAPGPHSAPAGGPMA